MNRSSFFLLIFVGTLSSFVICGDINMKVLTSQNKQLSEECFTTWLENQFCEWYPNCLQEKYQCGKKGYPISYGYKYCQKFRSLKSFPQVQTWVNKTLVCLKQKLVTTLSSDVTMNCDQLKKKAFQSHPICYEQCGFCSLFKELGYEKSAIFFDQLSKVFNASDFQSIQAWKQIQEMAKICLTSWF